MSRLEDSAVRLMEWYEDTLDQCGLFLLEEEDLIIEHHIFEDFDTGQRRTDCAAGQGLSPLARGDEVLRRNQTFTESV